MNLDQQNKLDAFLSGRMTPDELQSFQAELGSNPELQQQVAFQSEVTKGISEYRKAQLKARLDAIDVTPTLWTSFQQSTVAQFVAGAVAVSIISASLYLYFSSDNTAETQDDTVDELIIQPKTEAVDTLTVKPEANHETVDENQPVQTEKSGASPTAQEQEAVKEKEPTKPFNPKVAVPKAGDVEAEKEFTPDELPTPEVAESSTNDTAPIEVEVVDGRGKIKYRYYAGKLFLYGDFTAQPYEILEINTSKDRRIYLYHLEAYYEITPSDKPVNVVEVTDQKIIQELTILRKAK